MKSHVSCFESMGYEQVRQAWKKIFDHQTSDSRMNPTAQKGKKIKASKNKTKKRPSSQTIRFNKQTSDRDVHTDTNGVLELARE